MPQVPSDDLTCPDEDNRVARLGIGYINSKAVK
jgi:hypothetical protein